MAVRPTPPGAPNPPNLQQNASPVPPRAVNPTPPGSLKVTVPASPKTNSSPLASPSLSSPTLRPLPTLPFPKLPLSLPEIPLPSCEELEEEELGVDSSEAVTRPTPDSSTSPLRPRQSPRPSKAGIVRGTSEVMAQKANLVSAALSKGTLRSNSLNRPENARSSSFGSQSSEESSEDSKKKQDEKKSAEREAKLKLKEEKQKSKEEEKEKKDKKDDKRRTVSVSHLISSATQVFTSSSDSSLPTKAKLIKQKSNGGTEEDAGPAPLLHSSSLGASSPIASSSLEPRKPYSIKIRKPKQYVQENAENYAQLVFLLMRNSFLLMRALDTYVKRADLDRFSKDFVAFFSWREITLDYIKTSTRQEVDQAESEGTLFRTNSLLTAIMSNYCQRIGKQYLKAVLGPSFQWLMESTLSFEIDPNQVDNAEVIKQNIFNMNYLANKFFKAVLNSNDAIPFEVREIANVLQTAVLKRFPNSKHSAVGGFFFLRFVCPAVLAPEKFDFALTDEHSATLRRPLVLVAKILQQIANDQKFNEPHMEPLNELISKWTVKVHQFFDLLVQKDHAALHKERDHVLEQMRDPSELERSLLEKVELTSTLAVHRIVLEHVDELVARYADKEKELGYNPASELSELFDSMGPPPEPERAKSRAVSVAVKK